MTFNEIVQAAVDRKASDIHLVTDLPPILRIDGELSEIPDAKPLNAKAMEQLVFPLMTEENKRRFEDLRDLDFGLEYEDGTRLRVNLHYEKNNIGMVARIINNKMPSLEEVDAPQAIYELLKYKQGLILLTGPTGCGKSTTLAAMISHLNKNNRYNIITLEDPIEYLFPSENSIIIQRQLGSDMHSFSEGLKHCLRQDPNVIMVGEMRDLETIATTITLAETGHLVLATLHTYNAAQTIDRIIDIFPPYQQNQVRFQLSSVLLGVMSQRLLPKAGGGRVPARELLLNTPAVANMIRENKIAQIKSVIETGLKEGMLNFERDIDRLVKEKLVEKEAAEQYKAFLTF
jgi:twitching motility protein PilT